MIRFEADKETLFMTEPLKITGIHCLISDESQRIPVAFIFCDAYEFFTNFRIKELPIKLFPYNFVRPHKSFETRIIVVLY